jgi:hypothetical protein
MGAIETLHRGQNVVYFKGESLARARMAPAEHPQFAIADAIWEAALRGELDLSQRKLADGQYAYRTTRRRVVDKCPARGVVKSQDYRRPAA